MNDNELYDSILRDLSDGKIQSLRKKSIAEYFEMPTHATAAAILLSEWRGFVIYEKTGERSGQFWRRIKGGSFEEFSDIITEASELIVAKTIDYANPFAKNAKREFFGQYATALKHARSKDFIQSALVFFAEKVTIPELSSRWNTVPECIAILDGIADFSGNELVVRDAAPGEFFRTPLPISETGVLVPHEPKAFLAFLHDVFPDDSVRKTALQTLSLGIANRGVRIFSVWVGRGANGKSLLAEIMRHVLGSRAVAISGAALTRGNDGAKRFAASELAGATFAFAEEVVGALDVSECKRLTGGTTIRVERKGLDSFETGATWALNILSNNPPTFTANDSAFLNRLIVIPFNVQFYTDEAAKERFLALGVEETALKAAKLKEDILTAIEAERADIVALLIKSWIAVRARGGVPDQAPACLAAYEKYRFSNDRIEQFFLEYFQKNEFGRVDYETLLAKWSEFFGEKNMPSTRNIIKQLRERFEFLQTVKAHSVLYLTGLSLLPEETGTEGTQNLFFNSKQGKIEKGIGEMENDTFGTLGTRKGESESRLPEGSTEDLALASSVLSKLAAINAESPTYATVREPLATWWTVCEVHGMRPGR